MQGCVKTSARGFSFIDLVVSIGILAVSAAYAFPRFIQLETDSRKALVKSMGVAVNSAAQQAHYLWILKNEPATITMEGQTISLQYGYPDRDGIDDALMDYTGFEYKRSSYVRFRKLGAPAPNTCMVRYDEADPGQRPAVTIFTSGC